MNEPIKQEPSEPDYETQLAAWKAKHGVSNSSAPEVRDEETRMNREEAASTKKCWCFHCDAKLPVKDMKLITRRLDPYTQIDDETDDTESDYIKPENRVRMCPKCFEEKYGDGPEPSDKGFNIPIPRVNRKS